jgi:hypothetical protein
MPHERRLQNLEAKALPAMVQALVQGMRAQPLPEQGMWLYEQWAAVPEPSEPLWAAVLAALTEPEWEAFVPEPMRRFLDGCTLDELDMPAEALWPKWQQWLHEHAADPE